VPDGDAWRVAWRGINAGASPVFLEAAWIPHGRFRGEGRIPLDVEVAPGASHCLEFRVHAREAPGTLVENAFLILRLPEWRVFVRMRIEFDVDARPRPIVEQVTTQQLESAP
jgi:hypothetical protein